MDNRNNPMIDNGLFQPRGEDQSKGALVSSIIIIILLVAGGIYVLSTRQTAITPEITNSTTTETIIIESTSTDVDQIEIEVNQGELDQIEQEMEALDDDFSI